MHLHNFATCDIGKFDIPTSAKRAGHGEERNLSDVALSFSISINLCLNFLSDSLL